ncbi:MAG: hypothetical protein K2P99_00240 [Burkholderiales bacterium]|nr:hypothetical protein [Burkholderiales bacterium]
MNGTFNDLPQKLTIESIRIDCNSYLIPEVEEIEDGVNFIDERCADLFAMELASWTEDESVWPQEFSLKMFWEWFDVEVYPTAIDLTDETLDDNNATKPSRLETTIH